MILLDFRNRNSGARTRSLIHVLVKYSNHIWLDYGRYLHVEGRAESVTTQSLMHKMKWKIGHRISENKSLNEIIRFYIIKITDQDGQTYIILNLS